MVASRSVGKDPEAVRLSGRWEASNSQTASFPWTKARTTIVDTCCVLSKANKRLCPQRLFVDR